MRKWIGIVAIVMTGSAWGQALPPNVTPQMIQAVKDMPLAQQQALAKQYGITLPASSATATANNSVGAQGEPVRPQTAIMPAPNASDKAPEEVVEKAAVRFGRDLFNRSVSTFAPTDDAPVPETYRLGVGDEVLVQLFGKDNDQLVLQVGRNGEVIFPKLGAIALAGLTFEDARHLIKTRIQQQLIGVDAIVSMGRLRAIGIFMAGEVAVPGAYSVSALTTVTQALFQAGGVSDIGSLRNIQVRRRGDTAATFDTYALLMHGSAEGDIRLQSGDVVFVPPYTATAELIGEVKRPMVFELNGTETIQDLVQMGGRFTRQAFTSLAVLTRLSATGGLPEAQTLDLMSKDAQALNVQNGDILRIPKAGQQVAKSVSIKGAVNRPGEYGWYPGLRVSDLIQDARSDLRREADLSYALIVSVVNDLLDISVRQFSLAQAISAPNSSADPELGEFDSVIVFALPNLTTAEAATEYRRDTLLAPILDKLAAQAREDEPVQTVSVSGAVRAPGTYPLFTGTTVADMVQAAGGLKDSAYLNAAELRTLREQRDGQLLASYQEVSLQRALNPSTSPVLQSRDHLTVREIPDWSPTDS
ncbi:MAG: SLBB domain-containing protein, partial [Halieaceae bacterium]|nr:SLBB domain-containing protein [Halieaceae bacterium]